MKTFPYFFGDLLLGLFALSSILLSVFLPGINSYALTVLSLFISALLFKASEDRAADFRAACRNIRGLESWESELLSYGTLVLIYKGERARFSSAIGSAPDSVPVDYLLSFENGAKASFEAGLDEFGRLGVGGDAKAFAPIQADVAEFDRKYPVLFIRNRDGILDLCVRLEFEKGPRPPREEKLSNMAAFLSDYLAFGYSLNSRLKAAKPKARPSRRKA